MMVQEGIAMEIN